MPVWLDRLPRWQLAAAAAALSVLVGYVSLGYPTYSVLFVVLPTCLVLAGSDWAFLGAVATGIVVPHYLPHAWLVVPALGVLALVRPSLRVAPTRVDVVFAMLVVWNAASWKLHPELAVSLRAFLGYSLVPAAGYVFSRAIVRRENLYRFLATLLSAGTAAAVSVLYEWAIGHVVFNDPSVYQWEGSAISIFRAGGVFGGAPTAAVSLSMILVAALPIRRSYPRLFAIAAALILGAVAVTYARAGWLGLVVGLVCVAGLLPVRHWGRAAWVASLAAVAFLVFQPTITQSRVFKLGVERRATINDRTSLLRTAAPLIADSQTHLFFGRGFYALHTNGQRDLHAELAAPVMLQLGGPHNDYVRAILEQGLVGLTLLIAWLGLPLRAGMRLSKRLPAAATERFMVAALTGSVVVYAAAGLFHDESHATPNLTLAAFVVGALAAVTAQERRDPLRSSTAR